MPSNKKKNKNFYDQVKRPYLEERRNIRKKILGDDDIDASSHQRKYNEATKTKKAIKTELFGDKSKPKDTKIEQFVEDFLTEEGIEFKKQKRIRYLNYDVWIPSANLLIECQGDYYHCNPKIYPDGPKNNMQRKNLEKNKIKRELAKEAGIKLLEIWEDDIKNRPEEVKKNTMETIKENEKLQKVQKQ